MITDEVSICVAWELTGIANRCPLGWRSTVRTDSKEVIRADLANEIVIRRLAGNTDDRLTAVRVSTSVKHDVVDAKVAHRTSIVGARKCVHVTDDVRVIRRL